MTKHLLDERRLITSFFVFNVISLMPGLSMFWHSLCPIHSDDGPAVTFLLIVTAVYTLFVLPLYSGAALLIIQRRRSRVSKCISSLLLIAVFTFCVGSSIWWAKFGMDGELIFIGTATLYAVFSVRLAKDIALLFRLNASSGECRR